MQHREQDPQRCDELRKIEGTINEEFSKFVIAEDQERERLGRLQAEHAELFSKLIGSQIAQAAANAGSFIPGGPRTQGRVGTLVMTMMMMFIAPMITGMSMDIAALIGDMAGNNYMLGMVVHIMMGVVIFPLIYVFVLYERLPGPPWLKGIIWGIILWAGAATVIMPVAGAGFLMSNIGGMMALVAALMGHIVYGVLLGAIAGSGEKSLSVSA